jgi:hypothetical protein
MILASIAQSKADSPAMVPPCSVGSSRTSGARPLFPGHGWTGTKQQQAAGRAALDGWIVPHFDASRPVQRIITALASSIVWAPVPARGQSGKSAGTSARTGRAALWSPASGPFSSDRVYGSCRAGLDRPGNANANAWMPYPLGYVGHCAELCHQSIALSLFFSPFGAQTQL